VTARPVTAGGARQPLRADARRNRAKVLAAARSAFADEGLSVPLDEIARRAGVGAGTVHRHFPTKEALFEAVVLSRVREHIDQARALASDDDPETAFFRFLRRMIEDGDAKRDLVDALAGAGVDTSAVAAATEPLRRAIGELLARAQRAGAVRDGITATDLMALLTGTFLATRQHPGDAGLRDRVWTVVVDGLRAGRAAAGSA
jgi:AcrR family transcriptional regulator